MYFFVVELCTFLLIDSPGGLPMTENGAAWQEAYKAAMLELDPTKLRERILFAQCAISKRMDELLQDHLGTPEERQAISDALHGLNVLEREIQGKDCEQRQASRLNGMTGTAHEFNHLRKRFSSL
jgi:hypothetical protein